jgi:hypothetical protein
MIVASTEFATEAPQRLCAVEEFSVASFAATQTAFGLAEETVSLKNN